VEDASAEMALVELITKTDVERYPLPPDAHASFLSTAFEKALEIFFPSEDPECDIEEAENQSLLTICQEICRHLPPAMNSVAVVDELLLDVDRMALPHVALDSILKACKTRIPLEGRPRLYAKLLEPMLAAPTNDDGDALLTTLAEAVSFLPTELKASFRSALTTRLQYLENSDEASGLSTSQGKLQHWIATLEAGAQ
jgi:hypothetical protein